MAEGPEAVEVGQIWKDNDKRMASRYLQVQRIEGEKAVCLPVIPHRGNTGWTPNPWGRETRIALRRFRPTSTGYVLVGSESPVQGVQC